MQKCDRCKLKNDKLYECKNCGDYFCRDCMEEYHSETECGDFDEYKPDHKCIDYRETQSMGSYDRCGYCGSLIFEDEQQ